jgi:tyrosine-protein phosphatase SIW14
MSRTQAADFDLLVPPTNFSLVSRGVYRGSYPNFQNFSFLEQLEIRSILFLCPEEYSPMNREFLQKNDIELLNVPMEGNKEPFKTIDPELVHRALTHVTDTRNHPIYIHCNKGKHRTGTVIGCLRKLQLWTLTSIFDEYRRFAGIKSRAIDQQYIELYVPSFGVIQHEHLPTWLAHLQ